VTWNQGGFCQGSEFKIFLDIPNQQIANPYKSLWINMVYQGNVSFSWVSDFVTGKPFTQVGESIIETNPTNGWKTFKQEWRFEPNPREEIVVIGLKGNGDGLAAIDKICIDTWCVPEPATMAIFGLGTAVMFYLRKKA
jgi:hypothetical protein